MRMALIVAAADKLHNARAFLADYRQLGEDVWSRFRVGKAEQLWLYNALVETIKETAAPEVLVGELDRVVRDLKAECD
jgi:hypothetical protein